MTYLLDTNTCIRYLNRSSEAVVRQITTRSPDEVCICDIVKFELYYGAYRSSRIAENLQTLEQFFADLTSYPFDGQAAQICGRIRTTLQNQGTPIGAYDVQIAAIALTHNLTLVTHNTREFSRVDGLAIEDWEV